MKATDPLTESAERIELGYRFVVRESKKKRAAAISSVGSSKKEKATKAAKISKAITKSKPKLTKQKIDDPQKKIKSTSSKDTSGAKDQKQKKSRKKPSTVQSRIPQQVTLLDVQNAERNRLLQTSSQAATVPTAGEGVMSTATNQDLQSTSQTQQQPNAKQLMQQQQHMQQILLRYFYFDYPFAKRNSQLTLETLTFYSTLTKKPPNAKCEVFK